MPSWSSWRRHAERWSERTGGCTSQCRYNWVGCDAALTLCRRQDWSHLFVFSLVCLFGMCACTFRQSHNVSMEKEQAKAMKLIFTVLDGAKTTLQKHSMIV